MTAPQSSSLPLADPAMLLVLLPGTGTGELAATRTALDALQRRVGSAIRVMKISEASHPAVVRSFHATELPACVLVRQGVELWRQQGLPDDENLAALLLSKAAESVTGAEGVAC